MNRIDFNDLPPMAPPPPPVAPPACVRSPDLIDPDAFAARIAGDSMAPKYREGEIVIFAPSEAVLDGADCFVRFANGHTTFKRVFRETEDGRPVVRLQPRNPKHAPQVVPAEEVDGIYPAAYRYEPVNR